jgi:uncharacterized membrane protein (UPF0127 family)
MEVQKYCVYNQTRESFLSLGVTVADPATAQVRELIDKVGVKPDSGLWMVPYRGNLPARGHSPVDLLYLDSDYRVIQEVESFLPSSIEPLKEDAASALVLPAHTIYSSQTQPGDQMVICIAEEMERRLERLSGSLNAVSHAQSAGNGKEKQASNGASVSTATLTYADTKNMSHSMDNSESSESRTEKRGSLLGWIQNWLSSSADRRRAPRHPLPGVVAYYWTGSAPRAYPIADISSTGFYVLTEERWFPGTMVLMTLQRTDGSGKNLNDSIAVQSRVVRWGSDGLGLAFVLAKTADPQSGESARENGVDKRTLERFLERLKESASALGIASR